MVDDIFHVSRLRCEPNKINPSGSPEYYGPVEGYTFLRVYIDDQLLTDFAQPFTAFDPVIELFGSWQVPIWGDGSGYISVRQLDQYVIWSVPLEETVDYFLVEPGVLPERFIIFDVADYMQALQLPQVPITVLQDNAASARRYSHNLKYLPSQSPEVSLPQLSSDELRWLLQPVFPGDDLPLYRIPESADDARGVKLLRRIKTALENSDDIFAAPPPASWLEIHIGLDLPEFEECIWHIGKTPQGCAILFASNPHFPIWLFSSAINQAVEAELIS